MDKKKKPPVRIKTIADFHQLRGLGQPEHPLISVVDYSLIAHNAGVDPESWSLDFYSISMKRTTNAKIKYGQQQYDFDDGVLFFMAPHQVFSISHNADLKPQHTGWLLLFHPDFIWNTSLAKTIKQFEYFDYSINEALFLSSKEQEVLNTIVHNILQEYHSNIDEFSQNIIISHIETLLNYSDRFYRRQFITRKITGHRILEKLETLLNNYFSKDISGRGLPSVQFVATELNVSANYLSSLLKLLTGKSTQSHIHDKLIEKAKEKLSTTDLTINEIASELGFGHAQSFSKLFKTKTEQSPAEFRQAFQ